MTGTLVAGVCAVALAACSSGTPPSATATGKGTPAQIFTAHELNLVASDFPSSWKTLPTSGGSNVVRSSLNACAAQNHAPAPASSATSKNFLESSTGQEVGSQVLVFNENRQASSTATIAGSEAVSSCLGSLVKAGLASTLTSQESVTNVSVGTVDTHSAAPHSFAQQVVTTISYPDKTGKASSLDVYVLVDGFSHGPATVEAEFENPGSAPSEALVNRTMTTLVKRAGS